MRIEIAEYGHCGDSRIAGELVLERGEVSVLKCLEELITKGSVNVTTFVVFSMLFSVLTEKRLLLEGGCPRRDSGCATWVGWADEWVSGDEGVLCLYKYDPEVAILAPALGTIN